MCEPTSANIRIIIPKNRLSSGATSFYSERPSPTVRGVLCLLTRGILGQLRSRFPIQKHFYLPMSPQNRRGQFGEIGSSSAHRTAVAFERPGMIAEIECTSRSAGMVSVIANRGTSTSVAKTPAGHDPRRCGPTSEWPTTRPLRRNSNTTVGDSFRPCRHEQNADGRPTIHDPISP